MDEEVANPVETYEESEEEEFVPYEEPAYEEPHYEEPSVHYDEPSVHYEEPSEPSVHYEEPSEPSVHYEEPSEHSVHYEEPEPVYYEPEESSHHEHTEEESYHEESEEEYHYYEPTEDDYVSYMEESESEDSYMPHHYSEESSESEDDHYYAAAHNNYETVQPYRPQPSSQYHPPTTQQSAHLPSNVQVHVNDDADYDTHSDDSKDIVINIFNGVGAPNVSKPIEYTCQPGQGQCRPQCPEARYNAGEGTVTVNWTADDHGCEHYAKPRKTVVTLFAPST